MLAGSRSEGSEMGGGRGRDVKDVVHLRRSIGIISVIVGGAGMMRLGVGMLMVVMIERGCMSRSFV